MKSAKGKDLIFICRIVRDGSGVEPIADQDVMSHVHDTLFTLASLSITHGTYIASEFNSYVVRLKPKRSAKHPETIPQKL